MGPEVFGPESGPEGFVGCTTKMICLLFCEGKKSQKTKMAEAAHILVRSPAASGEGFPLFHCFNLLVCVVRSYDHPIIWRDLAIIP